MISMKWHEKHSLAHTWSKGMKTGSRKKRKLFNGCCNRSTDIALLKWQMYYICIYDGHVVAKHPQPDVCEAVLIVFTRKMNHTRWNACCSAILLTHPPPFPSPLIVSSVIQWGVFWLHGIIISMHVIQSTYAHIVTLYYYAYYLLHMC